MTARNVKSVNVWMTNAELKKVDRLAKKMHMDRSKYLRYTGTLEHDQIIEDLIEKVEFYKGYLTVAKEAIFVTEKLTAAVNFQKDTGFRKKMTEDIQKKLKGMREKKSVLKIGL